MGQCLSRNHSHDTVDDFQSSCESSYSDQSSDDFWDARSEISLVSAFTFLQKDSNVVEQALEAALEYQKDAKILKARESLLNAAEEEYWERYGDERVHRILKNASLVTNALLDLHLEEGYMLSREKPMRLLYKHENDKTCHSIKIKATLKHPVKHVVSIPYEWDLLPTWNKYAIDAVSYGSRHPHETVVYGACWMIPPFKDFHAILRATGFNVSEEHECLVITIQDCEHFSSELTLPRKAGDRRIVNFLDGSYVILKPVFQEDGVHTDAVLSVHLDPHIPGIPSSIVNFVLHVFAPYLFRQIDRTLEKLFDEGSMYKKRIESSPDIYQLIDDAVEGLRLNRPPPS